MQSYCCTPQEPFVTCEVSLEPPFQVGKALMAPDVGEWALSSRHMLHHTELLHHHRSAVVELPGGGSWRTEFSRPQTLFHAPSMA